jgi:hypothetical protein
MANGTTEIGDKLVSYCQDHHFLSVRAIRCVLHLLLSKYGQEQCFGIFIDSQGNGSKGRGLKAEAEERVPKALAFMYLFNYEDPIFSDLLGSITEPMLRRLARDSSKHNEIKGSMNGWHVTLFALLIRSAVDQKLSDRDQFVDSEEFIRAYRRAMETKDDETAKSEIRHIRSAWNSGLYIPFIENFRRHISHSVMACYTISNQLYYDGRQYLFDLEKLRSALVKQWKAVRYLHGIFYRHGEINQPILLAALLYTTVTKPSAGRDKFVPENASILKAKYPAFHELFYLIMDIAQVSNSKLTKDLPIRTPDESYFTNKPKPSASSSKKLKKRAQSRSPSSSSSSPSQPGTQSPTASQPQPDSAESPTFVLALQTPSSPGNGGGNSVHTQRQKQRALALASTVLNPDKITNGQPPPNHAPGFSTASLAKIQVMAKFMERQQNIQERDPMCSVWVVSDVFFHACCHRSYFDKFTPAKDRGLLKIKSKEVMTDSIYSIQGQGTVEVKMRDNNTNTFFNLVLEDVLYVPALNMNVISLPCLQGRVLFDEGELEILFDEGTQPTIPPLQTIVLKSMFNQRYCFFDYSRGTNYTQQLNNSPTLGQLLSLPGLTEFSYDAEREYLIIDEMAHHYQPVE